MTYASEAPGWPCVFHGEGLAGGELAAKLSDVAAAELACLWVVVPASEAYDTAVLHDVCRDAITAAIEARDAQLRFMRNAIVGDDPETAELLDRAIYA